jgi:putative alpha-1,2-mannosidase
LRANVGLVCNELLGIYNIAPGQQQYQIGVPQFEKITINLENGKKFTISNPGATVSRGNFYLQGMNLDKKPYNKLYILITRMLQKGRI